ncbi:hypothetical protein LVY72_21990 [Arthrobacter sp. I2-34]|uniref:Uncharacterized protein n=1 Tax=Arthrobacter hankyongi TaxID=2904801 RepID=A0ABS9LD19_9MICC|nr:hypothetical protein [Arthrobacter hankyongi]MCG2624565.1 hypothetical protein [Arthrobacter hankyongi]
MRAFALAAAAALLLSGLFSGVAAPAAVAAATGTIVAKYQTNAATSLYSSAAGTTKLATVPADYTVGTRTGRTSPDDRRVQVDYGSRTGWVLLSKVSKVKLSTPVGKLSWAQSAAKNIAKWCSGVPISTNTSNVNQASFSTVTSGSTVKAKLQIQLSTVTGWGDKLHPNHQLAVAIQYHECGHILQYRAYDYNAAALRTAMNRVYGKANGTEHMADCISDVMGAQRKGTFSTSGNTTKSYVAGYGGTCTAKHYAAAKRIIAGSKA